MGCKKFQFPNLLFLAFLVFLAFLLFKEFLAILSVFPLFPKDFRGSAGRRNPCLFCSFPCCFPKRQGKEDQGLSRVLQKFAICDFGALSSRNLGQTILSHRYPRILSGPLNRLNAILSLLHPLDRYRTPSAIGSAIGRPYLASTYRQELSTASF